MVNHPICHNKIEFGEDARKRGKKRGDKGHDMTKRGPKHMKEAANQP